MTLARQIGLNVPNVSLLSSGSLVYLLVERFDRLIKSDKIERVHQEDFCQILGYLSSNKYEDEGGPRLIQIVKAIDCYSKQRAADLASLAKLIIFNYLMGNCDGHAKNLSMIHSSTGPYLAPFYDLVATSIYQGRSTRNATSINGVFDLESIDKAAIIKEFDQFGISGKRMLALVLRDFKDIVSIGKEVARHKALEPYQATINLIIGNMSKRLDRLAKE